MKILKPLLLCFFTWVALALCLYLYLYRSFSNDSNEVALFYFINIVIAYIYSFVIFMIIGHFFLKKNNITSKVNYLVLILFSTFLTFFPTFDFLFGDFSICQKSEINSPLTSYGVCGLYSNVFIELFVNIVLMVLFIKAYSYYLKNRYRFGK